MTFSDRCQNIENTDENRRLTQQLEEALRDLDTQIEETSELYEQVSALYHLFGLFGGTIDPELIPNEAVQFCLKTIGAEKAFICCVKDESAIVGDFIGLPEEFPGLFILNEEEALFQFARDKKRTLIVNDFSSDVRMKSRLCREAKLEKVICTPLTLGEDVVGFIVIADPEDGKDFTAGDGKLMTCISHPMANVMENARLRREELRKKLVDRELEIAKEIQERLLPKFPTDLPGVSLDGRTISALTIGGDYFDFFKLDAERVAIALADAVGKGVSAGLLMTMLKGMLHALPIKSLSPSEVMQALNQAFCRQELHTHFVTMIYFIYDVSLRSVHLCVAGHEPPLVVRRNDMDVEEYPGQSLPLGLSEMETYSEYRIHLRPGDMLLGYSDGLNEAKNENREDFGIGRLKQILRENLHKSASQIADSLYEAVYEHNGTSSQGDDMTTVVVKAEIVDLAKTLSAQKNWS